MMSLTSVECACVIQCTARFFQRVVLLEVEWRAILTDYKRNEQESRRCSAPRSVRAQVLVAVLPVVSSA
jgi:hypothetical protein